MHEYFQNFEIRVQIGNTDLVKVHPRTTPNQYNVACSDFINKTMRNTYSPSEEQRACSLYLKVKLLINLGLGVAGRWQAGGAFDTGPVARSLYK